MNSRILVFIIAFVCIGIGLLGIMPYFSPPDTLAPDAEKANNKTEQTYVLWFARQSLKKGDAVSRASLYKKNVPESQALQYGFDSDVEVQFKKNMVANQPVEANAAVSQLSFSSPEDPEYLNLVGTPDLIPYSLALSKNNRVGDIVRVNDYVDILALTLSNKNLANERVQNDYSSLELTTVLSNIRVIRTDNSALNVEDIKSKTKGTEKEIPTQIIIELTPEQLSLLLIVQEMAQIKVVKHIDDAALLYHAKISTVFPEQRKIRQLRGERKAFDPQMVIQSEE